MLQFVQPLSPDSDYLSPQAIAKRQQFNPTPLGGVFSMPLKTVNEPGAAKYKNYKLSRNAPRIPIINEGIAFDHFITTLRAAGTVLDDQNVVQMLQGPLEINLLADNSVNVGAAIGRAIDNDAIL